MEQKVIEARLMSVLLTLWMSIAASAQSDSIAIGNYADQFPKLQPLKVDMTKILPDKQKASTTFSPVFHTDWQPIIVPTANSHNMEVDMRRTLMTPYWPTFMFDDVRVQPLFKIKSGKNSFSFGIGVDMDAVRRGIDFQRMEQRQQQMMRR